MELLLAIEGGGTKTRLLLTDVSGEVLTREIGGPASGLYISKNAYAREMAQLLKRIQRAARTCNGTISTVGLAGPMDPDLVEAAVRDAFGKLRFIRTDEGEIAFALHDIDWGVSLVAGTGASCRARTPNGASAGCGGFGPQFGDEGSGYWIGRAAISAALRAWDGRGPETMLTQRLRAFYGVSQIYDIVRLADRSGHVSGTRVAAFVPEVFDAARAGDSVAKGICREAGTALAALVVATTRKFDWPGAAIPLLLTGGVFHGGPLVLASFTSALRKSSLAYAISPAVPEPAAGIIKVIQRERNRRRGSRRSKHVSR